MRVLHVNTHVNIGGIGNYILTLSSALKKIGVDCVIASSGGGLEAEFKRERVEHEPLNINTKFEFSPKVLISGLRLAKIIKDRSIDIMHAHSRVSQAASFLASKMTGIPFVTTCHGYFRLRLRKIFDTWGDAVIAISEPVKKHLIEDLGVQEERVELIRTGIDPDKFTKRYSGAELERMKAALGLDKSFVIGSIGRLSPVKGQKVLIEAMAAIAPRRGDVHALIVGDGPDEGALKDLAGSLKVKDRIRFVHADIDTGKYLAMMDAFIFPSIKEGLGLGLLEALAAGRPSIASDIGGIRDIIEDGVNGMLVPPEDAAALAGAITRVIENDSLAREMGERGREFVSGRFSLDRMAEGVKGVYLNVTGKLTPTATTS